MIGHRAMMGAAGKNRFDPYWSNVVLALPCDGANGSTTFTDISDTPKTVAAYGNAQISTAQSKFGGSSAYFDGSGDYLAATDHADLDLGLIFTIEAFFDFSSLPNATKSAHYIVNRWDWSTSKRSYLLQLNETSGAYTLEFSVSPSGTTTGNIALIYAWTPTLGTWYHIAAQSTGSHLQLFINGTKVAETPSSITTFATDRALRIGADFSGDAAYHGYIDDLRITKGVARYTANFTPPTAPFPTT